MRGKPNVNLSKSVRWNVKGLPNKKKRGVRTNCNAKKPNDNASENVLLQQKTPRTFLKSKSLRKEGSRCRRRTNRGPHSGPLRITYVMAPFWSSETANNGLVGSYCSPDTGCFNNSSGPWWTTTSIKAPKCSRSQSTR